MFLPAHIGALHTHYWPVLLTRSLVLANTTSFFSVMYFLICSDVILVQLHKNMKVTSLIALNMQPRETKVMLKLFLSFRSFRNDSSTHLPNAMSLL